MLEEEQMLAPWFILTWQCGLVILIVTVFVLLVDVMLRARGICLFHRHYWKIYRKTSHSLICFVAVEECEVCGKKRAYYEMGNKKGKWRVGYALMLLDMEYDDDDDDDDDKSDVEPDIPTLPRMSPVDSVMNPN
jgi:hypothetical protein